MPKEKKPTKTINIKRLEGVQKMGKELELNLRAAQKEIIKILNHIEHSAHGQKRTRRRGRP